MASPATALAKAYDLTLWMAERVARFPRTHHYTVGQRMVTTLLDVQELLIEAHYSKEKRSLAAGEPGESHSAGWRPQPTSEQAIRSPRVGALPLGFVSRGAAGIPRYAPEEGATTNEPMGSGGGQYRSR